MALAQLFPHRLGTPSDRRASADLIATEADIRHQVMAI